MGASAELEKVNGFIASFQKLERLIGATGGHKNVFRDNLDAVAAKNSFIEKRKGEVLDLYALRNVYSHMERGDYVATITDKAIAACDSLINELEHPPTVVDLFGVDVYTAHSQSNIRGVMKTMTEKEYTHVPVYSGGRLTGVFAYNSFFQWVNMELQQGSSPRFEKETMGDINPRYLNGSVVRFSVISATKCAGEVPNMFSESTRQGKRFDCALITTDGQRDSKIVGIITAWDLYKV